MKRKKKKPSPLWSFKLSKLFGLIPRMAARAPAGNRSWMRRRQESESSQAVLAILLPLYQRFLTHAEVARALGISPPALVAQLQDCRLLDAVHAMRSSVDRRLWV